MLLKLAGWSDLNDYVMHDIKSRAILRKKGAAVAVSAVAGPLGTGFGVWKMSGSAVASVVAALAVLILVMIADRDFIFASDSQTRVPLIGQFRLWLLLMLAFPTAYSIWIVLNHDHLASVAADIRAERATEHQTSFDGATGMGDARAYESAMAGKLTGLRQQRLTPPADVTARKLAAAQCAVSVERRYKALLLRGVGPREASAALGEARRRCTKDARDADAAELAYYIGIDADIARARQASDNAARAVADAVEAKRVMIERAAVIDAAAVDPTSFAVGGRYLSGNRLALIELFAIYVVVVVCDGAGLLMASILGRSPAGRRFERDCADEMAPIAAEVAAAHQQIAQCEGLMRQAAMAAKANDALVHIRSEMAEVQRRIATENANAQMIAAPFLAAASSIRAMVAASLEADKAASRAHEINLALGRMADAIIARAARDTMQEAAA